MARSAIRPPQRGATPLSAAIVSGGFIFVSGQTATEAGGIEEQTKAVLEKIGEILSEAGAGYGDVVRCGVYLTDIRNRPQMNDVYATFFDTGDPPARSTIECKLAAPELLVEIDCVAIKSAP